MVLFHHFQVEKTTCLGILYDELALKKWRLRCLPHPRSVNQESERMSYSKLLLTVLMKHKPAGFKWVVPGDGSWFVLYRPVAPPGWHHLITFFIESKNDAENGLILILWSLDGIHSLLDVPKGTTHSTTLFTNVVMPGLRLLRLEITGKRRRDG
jgi:hypothetical protein